MGFPDRIERVVEIAHLPAKVWASLTTAEGLGSWFGDQATIDLRPGGADIRPARVPRLLSGGRSDRPLAQTPSRRRGDRPGPAEAPDAGARDKDDRDTAGPTAARLLEERRHHMIAHLGGVPVEETLPSW
ncbi:SRPBCC domain-containing protein [Pseudonocardia bannensis]|uniref:SRPBCC domain-containing protein n=1 Tax=Pseudonocardia bannensis TaxID=630973 RepID=UPI001FE4C12D|nr:SRPBCC domain-containing protein [Pseudonocardia bannensis]